MAKPTRPKSALPIIITALLLAIAQCWLATASLAADDTTGQIFEKVFASHKGKLGYDRFKVQFLDALEQYSQYRKQKAIALARDIGGRWAYGYSHGERNSADARQSAMQRCKKYRRQNTIDAPCKVYMVNKKIKLKAY